MMADNELRDILHNAFTDLDVREFAKLGYGKFAWVRLVNNETAFKIPRPSKGLHMAKNRQEIDFLQYPYVKLSINTPKLYAVA